MDREPGAFTVWVTRGGAGQDGPHTCKGQATIGRSPECEVQLVDGQVSRQHARISCGSDGALVIQDLGSRNGTFLGGRRLGSEPAAIGDRESVQIGSFWLSVARHDALWSETTATAHSTGVRTTLDRERHALCVDGALTGAQLVGHEYSLMDQLTARAPATISTIELGDAIWGNGQWDLYMLHNLIARVRKKIAAELQPGDRVIVNIPGAGYRVL